MKTHSRIIFLSFLFIIAFVFIAFSGYAIDAPYYAETENGNGEYYSSFSDAVAFLSDGGTITLKENITEETALTIPEGIVFDLGGHSFTSTSKSHAFCFSGGAVQGYGNIITSSPLATNVDGSAVSIIGSKCGIHIFTDASQIFNTAGGLLELKQVEITSTNRQLEFALGTESVDFKNFV